MKKQILFFLHLFLIIFLPFLVAFLTAFFVGLEWFFALFLLYLGIECWILTILILKDEEK